MKWTMFRYMDAAGDPAGEQGGGGGDEFISETPSDKGGADEKGAALETPSALGSAKGAGETADGGIDWEKITDAEYFGKVAAPEIEGATVNMDAVAKHYGDFCRRHHIAPEVVADFLKMDGENYMKNSAAKRAAEEAEGNKVREAFLAEGRELREVYTPDQIETACNTLAHNFAGDKKFMDVATTVLANNKTMVKMLLNWADTHRADGNTGAGNGLGSAAHRGFAATWTGNPSY